jgi:hypothetical protein
LTLDSGSDEEARNEHKKKVISLFATNSTIEKEYVDFYKLLIMSRFGLAVWAYFDFVNFIILINFILTLIRMKQFYTLI